MLPYIWGMPMSAWTDMTSPVEAPPVKIYWTAAVYFEYSRRAQARSLPKWQDLLQYPFLLLLEFPEQKILEGSNRFFKLDTYCRSDHNSYRHYCCLIISRNITKPLKKLTTAATAIAGGNYTASVELTAMMRSASWPVLS